jgi:hypothetical protein
VPAQALRSTSWLACLIVADGPDLPGNLIVRARKLFEEIQLAANKSLLLWPRPPLELRFPFSRCREINAWLKPQQSERRISFGGVARNAVVVAAQTSSQIGRAADVDIARAKAQEMDKCHAPRRALPARSHSPCCFNQGVFAHGRVWVADHSTNFLERIRPFQRGFPSEASKVGKKLERIGGRVRPVLGPGFAPFAPVPALAGPPYCHQRTLWVRLFPFFGFNGNKTPACLHS